MSVFEQFEEMGQSLLLAQEGRELIARAIAAKLSRMAGLVSAGFARLASRAPSIEGWHP
jgi:hypothetical protein